MSKRLCYKHDVRMHELIPWFYVYFEVFAMRFNKSATPHLVVTFILMPSLWLLNSGAYRH